MALCMLRNNVSEIFLVNVQVISAWNVHKQRKFEIEGESLLSGRTDLVRFSTLNRKYGEICMWLYYDERGM